MEVRFRHRARPGASFVVRFSLGDGELVSAGREWSDEMSSWATNVIWANLLEIAALPNEYLPREAGDGDIEVVAWA